MGAERSQWQFPANEVGKVIGWSDEASPSNPNASKGLVNKGPFLATADVSDDPDLSVDGDKVPTRESAKAYADSLVLNFKALNADSGFTFATTTTNVNWDGPFGGPWKVAHRFLSTDAATFAGARGTIAIMRQVDGSGTNGPAFSDNALFLSTQKNNYLTSAIQGEVDGLSIAVRQSALGDAGGILVNLHKVESASYGAVGIEQTVAWLQATTGTVLREIHTTIGAHIPSTDVRQGGFGFSTHADVGASRTGYLVYDNGGSWMFPFLAASAVTAGTDYFHVTGPGNPDGAGLVRVGAGAVALPSLTFRGDPSTGFFSNGVGTIGVTTAGVLRMNVTLGVRIGSGLTDPGAGILNVLTSIQIANTKVIGARETGYAGMTGGGSKGTVYDAATITLPQLAARVAVLQASLTTHGLIGA